MHQAVIDENTLRDYVRRAGGVDTSSATIHRLKGDASSRSYHRVSAGDHSFVVMVMPRDARGSEEASSGEKPSELPFVNVARYLEQVGIRVPRIHHLDESAGLMLLEDLGDETFEAALSRMDRETLYGQAIDLLATLRARGEREPDPSCIAFGRTFDSALYRWELQHFYEYGLVARSGQTPTDEEKAVLDSAFDRLAEMLDTLPKGFTHRDYQSRNLMVKNGELVVIDFQDALLGPRQYDLVALLRDSYVELDRPFVEKMLARYLDALEANGVEAGNREHFVQAFDLLTVQRKLKDGGRFIFIDRVKNNPSFLPSVPASFRYVGEAIRALGTADRTTEILAKYVPELR